MCLSFQKRSRRLFWRQVARNPLVKAIFSNRQSHRGLDLWGLPPCALLEDCCVPHPLMEATKCVKSHIRGVLGTLVIGVLAVSFFEVRRALKAWTKNDFRLAPGGLAGSLPNFDIRLEGQRRVSDYDLNTTDAREAPEAKLLNRVFGIDQFRPTSSKDAGNIRASG